MADVKRNQRNFAPWPENATLLTDAEEGGINPAEVINESLKRVGQKVAQEMAADRLKKLRKLAALS